MCKTLISLAWIVFLNVLEQGTYLLYTINFNPTITHEEAYMHGEKYGAPFFFFTVVIVLFCVFTNRLPGCRKSLAEKDA